MQCDLRTNYKSYHINFFSLSQVPVVAYSVTLHENLFDISLQAQH